MKLYNSLSRSIEDFKPINPPVVTLYTCGPTVYDHVHIGNLRTYIFEDILRRALKSAGYKVKHVMNITDIDDKTIARSKEKYPDDLPIEALRNLTSQFEDVFYDDAKKVNVDFSDTNFHKAADNENIEVMQKIINEIFKNGFAYFTEDGIFFDTSKYHNEHNPYGVLTQTALQGLITETQRTQKDEYKKHEAIDFALWKAAKPGEPSWDFKIDGKNIPGRPGWHIECSAMSTKYLGQPFDIHTGGVDLMFPHHENEIAQSRAANHKKLADVFMHSEHLLVDGNKMSKSFNNFYTLEDIIKRGIDPMAFRLLVLQTHYRSQMNFTWESLEAAQIFLKSLQAWADGSKQPAIPAVNKDDADRLISNVKAAMESDLNSAEALAKINGLVDKVAPTSDLLRQIDSYLGLNLADRPDIKDAQKQLIAKREEARKNQDWAKADELRKQLQKQDIEINDTQNGPIWSRR